MNDNKNDPILVSRGCPLGFERPYWETVGEDVGAAGRLTCEFSAEESCAFPLAHLIRFELKETKDEHSLTLKFPMRSLIVTMWSSKQVNCLADAVLDGTCLVLVALNRFESSVSDDAMLYHLLKTNTVNLHVIYVRTMEIQSDTFAPKQRKP